MQFWGDLSYLGESENKRYMATSYYSKAGDSLGVAPENMPHGTGWVGAGLINDLTIQGISINVSVLEG